MKLRPAGGRLKKETIKYGHRHRGHRFGYVSSDPWGVSIPAFASGVGLHVGAALDGFGIVLSLLMLPTRKFSRSQR